MPDISGYVSGAGVSLEQQGFRQFGAFATDSSIGALNSVFGINPNGTNPNAIVGDLGDPNNPRSAAAAITAGKADKHNIWDPTPYASAIASGVGQFDPKNKFLFKVHFRFDDAISTEAASLIFGGLDLNLNLSRDITFVVKQIDLPKYTFEYEEINMYNFRTKFLKRVMHNELGFMFYDDVGNRALTFMNNYLQLLSPITRRPYDAGAPLGDHGFAFTEVLGALDTSMRGALGAAANGKRAGMSKNIIDRMQIDQFYSIRNDGNNGSFRSQVKVNSFVFTNPRLTSFDMTEQDHEKGNDPATISAKFDYDALFIRTGQDGAAFDKPDSGYFEWADLLSGNTPTEVGNSNATATQQGNNRNPYINIATSFAGRALASQTNTLLNAAVGNGLAGQALGDTTSTFSSALGTNAQRTLTAIGNNQLGGGISLPKSPFVTDNSSGGNATAQTSSTGDAPAT